MKLKDYFKEIFFLPKKVSQSLAALKEIRRVNDISRNDIKEIKSDLNIIFRYMSGLELHPKMPERLIVNDYRDVSKDHMVRYLAACEYIKETDNVLDFAIGCGYGASCIKINAKPKKIIACDIDKDVVDFATKFFGKQGIEFLCKDVVNESSFEPESFDTIVSFETIEHVPTNVSTKAIQNFYKWLKVGGKVICSVPDEEINSFENYDNQYHFRHYTHTEFKEYLEVAGFKNISFIEQKVSEINNLPRGREFDSIIAIAYK
jgi:SAM-dependent methyltransferase